MPVKITKDRVSEVMKGVRALTKSEVLIGVPDTRAERKPEDGEKGPPASNALIGYVQEYGDPAKNIPARPFLVPGVQSIKDKAIPILKKAGQAALDGDGKDVAKSLMTVGLMGQSAVQRKITTGPFDPLAERTLKARAARGRTGTKPLIDTGQLRAAITFVLRDKGSK